MNKFLNKINAILKRLFIYIFIVWHTSAHLAIVTFFILCVLWVCDSVSIGVWDRL